MKSLITAAALAGVLALGACSDNDAATDTAVVGANTAATSGTADSSSAMAPAGGAGTASSSTASTGSAMAPSPTATHDTGIISQGSRDPESAGETVKDAAEDAAEAVGDVATAKK